MCKRTTRGTAGAVAPLAERWRQGTFVAYIVFYSPLMKAVLRVYHQQMFHSHQKPPNHTGLSDPRESSGARSGL